MSWQRSLRWVLGLGALQVLPGRAEMLMDTWECQHPCWEEHRGAAGMEELGRQCRKATVCAAERPRLPFGDPSLAAAGFGAWVGQSWAPRRGTFLPVSIPGTGGDVGLVVPQQHGNAPQRPAGNVLACESSGGEGVFWGVWGCPDLSAVYLSQSSVGPLCCVTAGTWGLHGHPVTPRTLGGG